MEKGVEETRGKKKRRESKNNNLCFKSWKTQDKSVKMDPKTDAWKAS